MLENYQNYYVYADLVKQGRLLVKAEDINLQTWESHYNGIFNVLRDGVETDYIQNMFVSVDFGNGEIVDLTLPDYYFNFLMWRLIVYIPNKKIGPQHLLFKDSITAGDIKKYIDKFFIIPEKNKLPNITLNNVIADTLYYFMDIDQFAMFLANTLNLEDSIDLMENCPEYDKILHSDLSNVPLEKVKNKGMELVHEAQHYIMESEKYTGHEHCLRNPFAAKEGINERQYKDNSINIGTKPDGQGSVYHDMINQSYITGGLNKLIYQYIDDASARVAQIISKKNVGDSGGFSRILGLNNVISFLNPDLDYDCGTNNLIPQFIPNKDILSMLEGRYYKLNYNSNLRKIGPNDSFLIGQTILLRSPITCASAAAGHGVCHHCYGDLAYTNTDINIGRIATEIITSQYTQMRLSAKHLLEAKLKEILWVNEFYNFFRIDINTINLRDDLDMKTFKGWKFVFNFDDIQLENDDDFFQHKFYMGDMYSDTDETPLYNEYINEFKVVDPDGNEYKIDADIDGEDGVKAKLFITASLSKLIREHISIDDESDDIIINLTELDKIPIFLVKMENNDLGKSLDEFNELINKKAVTKQFNIPELLQKIQLNTKKGGIHCTSVHLEIILMNQVRSAKNRLMMPNWRNYNEPYEVLTLNEALTDNPSIIISTTYRKLAKALNYPLSFEKYAPSIFDLFFMRKPKKFINVDHEVLDIPNQSSQKPFTSPVVYFHDHSGKRPLNIREAVKNLDKSPKTRLDD